jgi:DNA-binding transcriptional LysR family regulator
MRFDLLTLELFVLVCEERSITRAAERANTVASAVSKRISDLEELVAAQLFHRQPRGLELTPAAETLLRHARGILRDVGQMSEELAEHSDGLRGQVRLRAGASTIIQYLPHDLARFSKLNPHVRLDLEEGTSQEILDAVSQNAAEIGVFGSNVPAPGLETYPYRSEQLVTLVPPNHALAGRPAVRFADLLGFDVVGPRKGSSLDMLMVKAAAEAGAVLEPRIRVNGSEAVSAMVEAGLGIGVVPLDSATRYGTSWRVTAIPLDEVWATRQWRLCVRDTASLSGATRHLLEFLTQP